MFPKAKQIRVREYLENSKPYEFDALLVGDVIVAMDNGAILKAKGEYLEIIKEYPWYPVEFDA